MATRTDSVVFWIIWIVNSLLTVGVIGVDAAAGRNVMGRCPTKLLEEQKLNSHNNTCNNYYNEGNMVALQFFFEIKGIPYHRA